MTRDDVIADMYQAGWTMQQVGDVFQLTRGRVCQILKSKGVVSRPKCNLAALDRVIQLHPEMEVLVLAGVKPKRISVLLNLPYKEAFRQARKVARLRTY